MNAKTQQSFLDRGLFDAASTLFGFNSISNLNQHPEVHQQPSTQFDVQELLTCASMYEMSAGRIPDLWKVCMNLYATFSINAAPYSAMQFINK